jgi:hypothetical protein
MKIVKIIIFSAIVAFVVAFMKAELRHLMHEGFWPGLAGVIICVGMIGMMMALNARARKRLRAETAAQADKAPKRSRSENFGQSKVGKLLAAYPGPIKLKPSRLKWWVAMVLGAVMTAASVFVCVIACLSLQAGNKTAGIGIGVSILGWACSATVLCFLPALCWLELCNSTGMDFKSLFWGESNISGQKCRISARIASGPRRVSSSTR